VVFPFGADADKINGAANGFDVTMQHIALTLSRSKGEPDCMVDNKDSKAVHLANGSVSCKEECLPSSTKKVMLTILQSKLLIMIILLY
jgi:hypothetical protein